jgi:crotonobetainyl-CoA:carnitine CoA-transferase CaiB-like acyl-CoA transferase
MSGPFEGIKILDLSQVVSGPLATMLLSDQGAQVTKIEPIRNSVDVTRLPSFAKGGLSALYLNNNRGKRAISLDLTQDEGREIALEMAADADIFVQNFRPGACERLGLGYEAIRKVNPKIIYCSISGFGPTGPYSKRPVFDPIIQAVTGAVSRQVNPEIPIPDLIRNLVADKTTALTVAQAISAALFHRERTGEAQHIEVPMLDSFLYFFWPDAMVDKTMLDEDASSGFLLSTVYSLTETADGKMIYFVASDAQRHNLYKALGHPEWKEDPRFATIAASTQGDNLEQLGALIAKAFLEFSTDEAMRRMLDNDVPCGAILDADQVLVDPQVVHNESLVTWQHPTAGKIRQPRPAARFSKTPAEVGRSAAVVGQHNDEVLAELGRSKEEIGRLRKEGILG